MQQLRLATRRICLGQEEMRWALQENDPADAYYNDETQGVF